MPAERIISETGVVNLALKLVGGDQVANLSASTLAESKAARDAVDVLGQKRDMLLEQYNWQFALGRKELASDASVTPASGWSFYFTIPAEALRIIGLYDAAEMPQSYTATTKPWAVEADPNGVPRLVAEEDPAPILFVHRVTDVSRMPPTFVEVWATDIAEVLASSVANSSGKMKVISAYRDRALRAAKRTSAIQRAPEQFASSEWTDAAYGYNRNTRWRHGPILGS